MRGTRFAHIDIIKPLLPVHGQRLLLAQARPKHVGQLDFRAGAASPGPHEEEDPAAGVQAHLQYTNTFIRIYKSALLKAYIHAQPEAVPGEAGHQGAV